MQYFLVTENGDWADEISYQGYQLYKTTGGTISAKDFLKGIIDDIEKEHLDEDDLLEESPYPFTKYIGSNEDVEFESRDDIKRDLTIKEISKSEYNTLSKLLGESYGVTALL